MVIIPEHFIFVTTPRTGSRAIVKALGGLENTHASSTHHMHPSMVIDKNTEDLPVYAVIRNPYDQVLSWFHHAVVRHDILQNYAEKFNEFIEQTRIGWFLDERLNIYRNIATKLFLYEKDLSPVLNRMLAIHNLKPIESLEMVGKSPYLEKNLLNSSHTRELIENRFPEDIRLYNRTLRTESTYV